MIDKGSLVYTVGEGHLQIGTVTSRRVGEDKWAYYKIKWHNNERYEAIVERYRAINPGSVPPEKKEYRAGEIGSLVPEGIYKTVNEHLNLVRPALENDTDG